MSSQEFASVWDAIEDTVEDAVNMKLRSFLMSALKNYVIQTGISQTEAAKLFHVTQPRASELMRGKIHVFDLDTLVRMATSAGICVDIQVLQPTQ